MTSRLGRFETTSWSMILQASTNSEEKIPALEILCTRYWYPVYSFVRRTGISESDAEDLTQEFFADLLAKDLMTVADPARGKFRTFLLTCVQNFMRNQHRSKETLKRGGGRKLLSLDYESAEKKFQLEPRLEASPDKIFKRNWALALLDQVMDVVAKSYQDKDRGPLFESIQGYLFGEDQMPYAEKATTLGMTEGAVKVAVHRLRDTYGKCLRELVAETVSSVDEIDDEIRDLLQSLTL